jgi:predicted transcriptional regulator
LYQSEFLENAVEQVFSGKAYSLVTKLVDSHKIDNQELQALRKLLDKFS